MCTSLIFFSFARFLLAYGKQTIFVERNGRLFTRLSEVKTVNKCSGNVIYQSKTLTDRLGLMSTKALPSVHEIPIYSFVNKKKKKPKKFIL